MPGGLAGLSSPPYTTISAEWHPRFIRGHTHRQFRDDSTICLAEQKPVAIVTGISRQEHSGWLAAADLLRSEGLVDIAEYR